MRSTHKMPLMIVRWSLPGRPVHGFCAGNNDSSRCQVFNTDQSLPRAKRLRGQPVLTSLEFNPGPAGARGEDHALVFRRD